MPAAPPKLVLAVIDGLKPAMLERAAAAAAAAGVELDLREADMRELELGEPAAHFVGHAGRELVDGGPQLCAVRGSRCVVAAVEPYDDEARDRRRLERGEGH